MAELPRTETASRTNHGSLVTAVPPGSEFSTRRGAREGLEDGLDLSRWDVACALLERSFGPNWREEATVAQIRALAERLRRERSRPAA